MKIGDGETILFTGDSITDCGRKRPLGEGAGLGDGYVAFVNAIISACRPEANIRVLNTGIGGNCVPDLESRWQCDVIEHRADWLSVMIGINDAHRSFNSEKNTTESMSARYESGYRRLLDMTRPGLKGLVLMTPYLIEPDTNDRVRERMDVCGAVVKRLASDYDAVFVDAQAGFDAYLRHRPAKSLADDRVHPNKTGHMIIANCFLAAAEFICPGNQALK